MWIRRTFAILSCIRIESGVKLVGVAGVVSSCCNLVAVCFACIFMPYLVRFPIVVFLLWIMSGSVSVEEEGAPVVFFGL